MKKQNYEAVCRSIPTTIRRRSQMWHSALPIDLVSQNLATVSMPEFILPK